MPVLHESLNYVQGDPSRWKTPSVDLDFGYSAIQKEASSAAYLLSTRSKPICGKFLISRWINLKMKIQNYLKALFEQKAFPFSATRRCRSATVERPRDVPQSRGAPPTPGAVPVPAVPGGGSGGCGRGGPETPPHLRGTTTTVRVHLETVETVQIMNEYLASLLKVPHCGQGGFRIPLAHLGDPRAAFRAPL